MKDVEVEGQIDVLAQHWIVFLQEGLNPLLLYGSIAIVMEQEVGVENLGCIVKNITEERRVYIVCFFIKRPQALYVLEVELHGAATIGIDGRGTEIVRSGVVFDAELLIERLHDGRRFLNLEKKWGRMERFVFDAVFVNLQLIGGALRH